MPSFQAGPYKWEIFLDGSYYDLGVVEDAPRLGIQPYHEEIRGDNLGRTIQDTLTLGHNVTLSMVFQEWKPQSFKLWHPYGLTASPDPATTPNNAASRLYDIGCPASVGLAVPMKASRLYNCPSAGGQTYYFFSVAMYPNQSLEYLMGSRLRNVPVKLLLLPFEYTPGSFAYYTVIE